MDPMIESHLFKETDIRDIFSNVASLKKCNETLLKDLNLGGCGSAVFDCCIGRCFVNIGRYLTIYTEFA